MDPFRYRHTQIGWLLLGILGVVSLVVLSLVATAGLDLVLLIPLAIVLLVLTVFSTLTVSVTDEVLEAKFGVGPIRKRVTLADVRGFRVVRNRWYYGWGIRYIPGGWLYNVSGLSAVELRLRNGKLVRIGTDEPEALRLALSRVLGESPALSGDDLASDRRAARRYPIIVGGILAIVLVPLAVMIYVSLQPPLVTVSPAAFSVRSGLYGIDIPIGEIEVVSLESTVPPVLQRTNGFALGGTLRGHFRLEGLGSVQLFIQFGEPPYILVRSRDEVAVVNFRDADRTRDVYAALSGLVGAP